MFPDPPSGAHSPWLRAGARPPRPGALHEARHPLPAIITRIDQLADRTRDFLAPACALRLRQNGEASALALDHGGVERSFLPTELVHDQLVALTGVPQAYYRRMREHAPLLLEANVNAWLQRSASRHLVRTIDDPERPVVRAVVSDRYRALDHRQLLEAVLPTLHQRGVSLISSELSETRLHLKAVNERLQGEVRLGETVMAGVCISNSEVGLGALTIQPLIYTLRCTNGMILEDASLRRHHLGRRMQAGCTIEHLLSDETRLADDRAFFLTVRDLTRASLVEALFQRHLDAARRAGARAIPPGREEAVVDMTVRRHHLTSGEGGAILAHLRSGRDLTAWGLCSAITRTAQDAADYERSTELERLGGQLLGDADLVDRCGAAER